MTDRPSDKAGVVPGERASKGPSDGPGDRPLAGVTIALAEVREVDRLAGILEGDGATILRCPLVAILDAPDPRPVDAWLDQLVAGAFEDLVFLTGEGLRRLLARAQGGGPERHAAVVTALGKARKITRGPKPARALHEVGLATDLAARTPTSQGVMEALAPLDLRDRRVGLQLYGTEPNLPLVRFLEGAGASVSVVAPYIYAPAADEQRVLDLVAALEAGRVHVLAFTSASQVDRLWNVAQEHKLDRALAAGVARTKVAAIGPIVAEALEDRGVRPAITPEEPFVMKRLSAAIAQAVRGSD